MNKFEIGDKVVVNTNGIADASAVVIDVRNNKVMVIMDNSKVTAVVMMKNIVKWNN